MMKNLLKGLLFLTILNISYKTYSQAGKDGAVTITAANTVVNSYASIRPVGGGFGSVTLAAGSTTVNHVALAGFTLAPGDLVMIIQMQGGSGFTMDQTTTSANYGNVTAYGNAGVYEFRVVATVPNTTSFTTIRPLTNTYVSTTDVNPGNNNRAQVVKVPRYSALTVSAGASIIPTPWSNGAGRAGGIVAIEVSGQTILNGTIDVNGAGFNGGAVEQASVSPTNFPNYASNLDTYGAAKGESIAGSTFFTGSTTTNNLAITGTLPGGNVFGRGAAANGGGGGGAHNSGGGGGANANNGNVWNGQGVMCTTCTGTNAWTLDPGYVANGNVRTNNSGGGRGGYNFSQANADALTQGPGNVAWQGDNRQERGGLGGRPMLTTVNAPQNRLFLGGGGGAGDSNDGTGTSGANGGGIVFLLSNTITGTGSILANGNAAANTTGNGNDAPGGGGGGGTIVVKTNSLSAITMRANGGKGGDQVINNTSFATEAEGPGGGGGGGYVAYSGTASPLFSVNSGLNGTTNSAALAEFPVNGATSGATGQSVDITNTAMPVPTTEIALTQSASAGPYFAGQQVTYNLTVTNNSTTAANNIAVDIASLLSPSGLGFVSSSSATYNPPAGDRSWNIESLAPGTSSTLAITIRLQANTANANSADFYTVSARANAYEYDPNNNNNTQSYTFTPVNQPPIITSNGGGDIAAPNPILFPENSTAAVATVLASDPENNIRTFSLPVLAGSPDQNEFNIDPNTGVLTFRTPPNFENPTGSATGNSNTYTVIVRATDNGAGTLFDEQTININVTNVNEPPTAPTDANVNANTVAENAATGTLVGITANSTDPDANTSLTYTLTNNAGGRFAIDASTGVVTVANGTLLDFETATSHVIRVQASDGTNTAFRDFTIAVNNVNEPPIIISNGGGNTATVSVAENTVAVTTVEAYDLETGTTLFYSITGGADASKFTILSNGELIFNNPPDFENPGSSVGTNSYSVNVRVSDASTGGLVDDQNLTVNVTNVTAPPTPSDNLARNKPTITSSVEVPNTWRGSAAVDGVTNTNLNSRWSSAYADNQWIYVDLGAVYNVNRIRLFWEAAYGRDYDLQISNDANTWTTMQAVRGNTTANTYLDYPGLTGSGRYIRMNGLVRGTAFGFSIYELEVFGTANNTPPTITSNGAGPTATISVQENTTAAVTIVNAIDDDGNTITYSLTGTDAAAFTINSSTGDLIFNAPPDFETKNAYSVTVVATDNGTGSLSDQQALTINVTNANEAPSAITDNNAATNTVAENAANGTIVGITANATDPEGAAVIYTLTNNAGGRFAINSSTGVVSVANGTLIDFETASFHTITVQAADATTGALTSTQSFTIAVTNVNELPVQVNNTPLTVNEGATGTISSTLLSYSDAEANTLTYTINSVVANGTLFKDNNTNNLIDAEEALAVNSTFTQAEINANRIRYAHNGSETITDSFGFSVNDGAGGSVTGRTFTINVNPVSDAPTLPVDTNTATANTVPENSPAGTLVGITAQSTDPEGASITYSLTNSAGGRFTIDPSSGVVTVADGTLLDFENSPSHTITVQAADATSGGLTSTQTFTIAVTNVNEAPTLPVDFNAAANTVVEGASNNGSVGINAKSTDPEGATIIYSLIDNAGGRFSISPSTGVVSVLNGALIDYETATSHTIIIQASDAATGGLTSSQSFIIEVTDAIIDTDSKSVSMSHMAAATIIPSLSGRDGTNGAVSGFRFKSLPTMSQGILYVNGLAATTTTTYNTTEATQLTFDPEITFAGVINLTYAAVDGAGAEDATPAAYIITVTNSRPNATPKSFSVPHTSGPITASTFSGTDNDGLNTIIGYRLISLPAANQGILYVNNIPAELNKVYNTTEATQVTFDPNLSFVGVIPLSYTAIDNTNEEDDTPATYTITVTNNAPVAANKSISLSHNAPQTATPALTATDNGGTVEGYRFTVLPTAAQGILYVNNVAVTSTNTIYNTTEATQISFDPDPNYVGTIAARYVAIDDRNTQSAVANYNITVTNVRPTTSPQTATIPRTAPATSIPNLSGSDGTDGTIIGYRFTSLPTAAQGILYVNNVAVTSTATIYNTTGATQLTFDPEVTFIGTSTFNYTAIDNTNQEDSSPATYTITVTDVNEPPVITSNGGGPTADISSLENILAVTTVVTSDPNANSVIKYSLSGGADQSKFSIDQNTGVLTFISRPNFENPTDTDGNNTYEVNVRATDNGTNPGPLFDEQLITVTIIDDTNEPANQAPVGNDHTNSAVFLDSGDATAIDPLTGTDDVTIVYFRITQLPASGTFSFGDGVPLNTTDLYAWNNNGFHDRSHLQFNPSFEDYADVVFYFTVIDEEGLADATPAKYTILINGEPQAKNVTNVSIVNTAFNVPLNPGLDATDDNSIQTFRITTLPGSGTLRLNGVAITSTTTEYNWVDRGLLTFTPAEGSTGSVIFKYTVRDNETVEESTPATYTIPLTNNPRPVTAAVTPVSMPNTNGVTDITDFSGSDTAPGSITKYVIKTMAGTAAQGTLLLNGTLLAAGSEVLAADVNKVSFDPAESGSGTFSFTFTAVDNQGAEDLTPETYNIIINGNTRPETDQVTVNPSIVSTNNYLHTLPELSGSDANGTVANFIIKSIPNPTTQGILYLYNEGDQFKITANQSIPYGDRGGLRFKPVDAASGTVTFSYAAVDNQGAEDLSPANYNIPINANSRPIARSLNTSDPAYYGREIPNTAVKVPLPALSATDADGNNTIQGYRFTFLFSNRGIIYINDVPVVTNRLYTPAEAATLTYSPNGFSGSDSFNYIALDNQGAISNEAQYVIPTRADQRAIYSTPNTYTASALTNGQVVATPSDADGNIVAAFLTGNPLPNFLTLNSNGTISVNSNKPVSGIYATTITLQDNKDGVSTDVPVTIIINPDTDADGIADANDLDDDNDGIPDTLESNGIDPSADADNDGITNYLDADFGTLNSKGVVASLDKDSDGIINAFDLDSDNDGITDVIEQAPFGLKPGSNYDANTGRLTYTSLVNGIPNTSAFINATAADLDDRDGDGLKNFLDIDADNDGLRDYLEAQATPGNPPTLPVGTDTDKDGIDDKYDATCGCAVNGVALDPFNFGLDGDSYPDYLDINSDNDLYTDAIEAYDNSDPANADGYSLKELKALASRFATSAGNAGNNSATSYYNNSLDSDNDAIPDWLEDADQDGTLNFLDAGGSFYYDSDNDGWVDLFDTSTFGTEPAPNYAFRKNSVIVPLPVELLRFTAKSEKNLVRLNWETASEKDNDYFIIERSSDGIHFGQIGKPEGAGTKQQLSKYLFNDTHPLPGTSYYRLTMVDINGAKTNSAIISVKRDGISTPTLLAYPNPTAGKLTLEITTVKPEKLTIQVVDVAGKLIKSSSLDAGMGINIANLNMEELRSGMYLIVVRAPGLHLIQRVIKQ